MNSILRPIRPRALCLAVCAASVGLGATHASGEALLLVNAATGKVLHADNATRPWYPASVTKLMTAYVVLRAVKERRITLDKLLTVSDVAAAQQPSKMGFKPGTQVTVDNAVKMLMVKSANDMAIALAEGVSGSVENFATDMNRAARRLGMTQSSYVNPNGLPADGQVTSARDLAILARALINEFPEYDHYWNIPAIKFGKRVMRNYNTLIGRYPGADGMKSGFICASGFNLVASATRRGKRLIAVVLGARSARERAETAAQLLEQGFTGVAGLSWLLPSLGSVDALQPVSAEPPNLRDQMCGKNRRRPASESEDEDDGSGNGTSKSVWALLNPGLPPRDGTSLLGPLTAAPPVAVYLGPGNKPTAVARAPQENTYRAAAAPAPAPERAAERAGLSALAGSIGQILPTTSFAPNPFGALALTSAAEAAGAPVIRVDTAVPLPRPRPKLAAPARGKR